MQIRLSRLCYSRLRPRPRRRRCASCIWPPFLARSSLVGETPGPTKICLLDLVTRATTTPASSHHYLRVPMRLRSRRPGRRMPGPASPRPDKPVIRVSDKLLLGRAISAAHLGHAYGHACAFLRETSRRRARRAFALRLRGNSAPPYAPYRVA